MMIGHKARFGALGISLALATGLLTAASHRQVSSLPAIPKTSCASVVSDRKNTDIMWDEDAGGGRKVTHHLYSLLKFDDPPDVTEGKWVGIVIRNTPDGTTSPLFQSLANDEAGCIFFKYDKMADRSDAWFYLSTDTNSERPKRLDHAEYCLNDLPSGKAKHPDDMKPVVKRYPFNCESLKLTLSSKVGLLSVSIKDYHSGISDTTVLRNAIASAIVARSEKIETDELDSMTKSLLEVVIGETGPWFPCTQTDCCRVFSGGTP